MKILCSGPQTVVTHGETYVLRSGENDVPDAVGQYCIDNVKGISKAAPAATEAAAAPTERSGRG